MHTLVQNYRDELKQLLPYWSKFGKKAKLLFYHNSKDETIVIKFIGPKINQVIWAIKVADVYVLQDDGMLCKWIESFRGTTRDYLYRQLHLQCNVLGMGFVEDIVQKRIDEPLHVQHLCTFANDIRQIKEMLQDE